MKRSVKLSLSFIVLFCGLFFISHFSKSSKTERNNKTAHFLSQGQDFEMLMGKDSPCWRYVQTREDIERMKFFKRLYDKNLSFLENPSDTPTIPKVVHFIWLGPREFPKSSVNHIKSWIDKHPGWTFKFWTDLDRPVPHIKMQKVLIQEIHLPRLLSCYYNSDNFGEKSEILRYEILNLEGGVYVDHDVQCLQALDSLNESFDFYCGLEVPDRSILSSSIFPSTHLIASKPHHPAIESSLDWLKKKWDQLGSAYPGAEASCVINRVKHRSFSAFYEGIMQKIDRNGQKDIVFPSSFFSSQKNTFTSFARHLHEGSWHKVETKYEKRLTKEIANATDKIQNALVVITIVAAINILLVFLILTFLKSIKMTKKL
jgi:hypothetical protein